MTWLYKIVLPLSLLFLFFAEYIHPTTELNFDLGEHLLRGQIFFQTGSISTTNLFSYTSPDFHYVNPEWLTETIFYLVNSFSGINGLILLTTIITLCSLVILYTFSKKGANILLVSYSAAIYLLILWERANILPELFSYLFLSIFVVLLYKYREKYTNLIWLLVPLQLLWVNMHIYFIMGILLVGLFLIEASILFKEKNEGKYLQTLLLVFVGTCVVSLINPYGLNGLLFPLLFWTSYSYPVAENFNIFQSLSANSVPFFIILLYGLVSILLILLTILQFKKTRLIDVLISLVFIIGAAMASRVLGVFVFATFIPFIYMLNTLFAKYGWLDKKKENEEKNMQNPGNWINKLLAYSLPIIIIALGIWLGSENGGLKLGTAHGYENGVNFLINSNLKGPIFNNYNIGSYLAYRLYPKEQVFVDTRPEAYPLSFFEQVYNPMLSNLNTFQTVETKYKFNTIIYGYDNGWPNDIGFLRYLMQSKDWKVVYLDDKTVIFVKNDAQNKNLIQQYALSDNNFSVPQYQSPQSLYNLGNFLNLMGWKKSELEAYEKAYEVNPNNCALLYNIIILVGPHTEAATQYINSYYINRCRG